jgi:hypothetical protein
LWRRRFSGGNDEEFGFCVEVWMEFLVWSFFAGFERMAGTVVAARVVVVWIIAE